MKKNILTVFIILAAFLFSACDQNENVDIAGTYIYAGTSSWDNDAGAYSSFTMEISILEFYLYHEYQAGKHQEYLKHIDTSTVYYCPANTRQYSNTAHVITLSNGETQSKIDFEFDGNTLIYFDENLEYPSHPDKSKYIKVDSGVIASPVENCDYF